MMQESNSVQRRGEIINDIERIIEYHGIPLGFSELDLGITDFNHIVGRSLGEIGVVGISDVGYKNFSTGFKPMVGSKGQYFGAGIDAVNIQRIRRVKLHLA